MRRENKKNLIENIRRNSNKIYNNLKSLIKYTRSNKELPQTIFSKKMDIKKTSIVNCTYVTVFYIKRPVDKSYGDFLDKIKDSFNVSIAQPRPFSQHELVLNDNAVMISCFNENEYPNMLRLNILGPPYIEVINQMVTNFCHFINTMGFESTTLFCKIHRINSVFRVSMKNCLIDIYSVFKDKLPKMEYRMKSPSFPGFVLVNEDPDRGVSKIRVFETGEINFLGAEITKLLKFLPEFINYLKKHSKDNNTTIKQRRRLREINKNFILND